MLDRRPLWHDRGMRGFRRALADPRRGLAGLLAALLAACAPPPPVQVEGLAFPVLVLWDHGDPVRHDDATDLRTMSVQRVVNAPAPPWLIDSRLDIYRLEQLQSVHGGLWLLANPSGATEVSFTLTRVAQGDAAQAGA